MAFLKRSLPVPVIVLAVMAAAPARAELTLQQYLNYRGTPQGEERLDAYLNGLRDALAMFEDYERAAGALSGAKQARVQSLYCIPDSVSLNPELLRSLLDRDLERYRGQAPAKLAVGDSILNGLTETFPCAAGVDKTGPNEAGQMIGGGAGTAAKPAAARPAQPQPQAQAQAPSPAAAQALDPAAAALDAALSPRPAPSQPEHEPQAPPRAAAGDPAAPRPPAKPAGGSSAAARAALEPPAMTVPVPLPDALSQGLEPMQPMMPVMPPTGGGYPSYPQAGYPQGYYPQPSYPQPAYPQAAYPGYPPGYIAPSYPQPSYPQPYPMQGYGQDNGQNLPERPSLILPPGGKPPASPPAETPKAP